MKKVKVRKLLMYYSEIIRYIIEENDLSNNTGIIEDLKSITNSILKLELDKIEEITFINIIAMIDSDLSSIIYNIKGTFNSYSVRTNLNIIKKLFLEIENTNFQKLIKPSEFVFPFEDDDIDEILQEFRFNISLIMYECILLNNDRNLHTK